MKSAQLLVKTTLTAMLLAIGSSFAAVHAAEPPAGDCTGTLSGSVTGTFKCVMVAVYGFSPGVGGVSFTPAAMPAGVQSVTAAFQLQGEPRAGSISIANCVDCTASLTENTGALYMAQKKTNQGTASLTVSAANRVFQTPEGSLYTVHGTIDADMPQLKPDGGTGMVRMHVDF